MLLELQVYSLAVSQCLYFADIQSQLEVVFTKHFLKCWIF